MISNLHFPVKRGDAMKVTLTAKVKINPSPEQVKGLLRTSRTYRQASNFVAQIVFERKILSATMLHTMVYRELRATFSLRSQMAQSVIKTVVARYKSLVSNGHLWTRVQFKKPEYYSGLAARLFAGQDHVLGQHTRWANQGAL